MKKIEMKLRAVLPDIREGRLGLAEAVENICATSGLRDALLLDLQEMVIRDQKQHEFLSKRSSAGLELDPATAEVTWRYAEILDPYGILDLSPEERCVGRVIFARARDSKLWISENEIPNATKARMKKEPDNDW
jgi:hypothetical protein